MSPLLKSIIVDNIIDSLIEIVLCFLFCRAVMKWAVYAPALLHPLLYFTFSPEARHGAYILFSRCCSCCCTKSTADVETASDDEKGQMLNEDQEVPLQSKQEEEM